MENEISTQDKELVKQVLSKSGKKYSIFNAKYSDKSLMEFKGDFFAFLQKIIFDFGLEENELNKRGLQNWFNKEIKRIENFKTKSTTLPFKDEPKSATNDNEESIFNLTDPTTLHSKKKLLTKPKN